MCDCNKQVQSERKPHVHAGIIKAWADGAVIQYYNTARCKWEDLERTPSFARCTEYRVKPEPKTLTDLEKYGVEVGDVWINRTRGMITHIYGLDGSDGIRIFYQEAARPASIVRRDLITLLFRRGVVDKL